MEEASPIGGWVRTRAGVVTASRTKGAMRSVVTTSLPCSTCAGSTTDAVGGHHAHGEVVQVTACGLQLFRRGVDFNSQRLAQDEGSFRVMLMVSGSRGSAAGRYYVARCFVAHRDAHVHRQGHCGGREVHVDAAWQVSTAVEAQGGALGYHRCGHAGVSGNQAGELRSGRGWCRRRRWARCRRWGWGSAAAAAATARRHRGCRPL